MALQYNLKDHGDLIEKEGALFASQMFPFYELVWQTYIGNTGNATIAPLPDYPAPSKRISFSEYSYTIFESSFLLYTITKSGIFTKKIINLDDYLEMQKCFLTYYACLGRIKDNTLKACNILGYQNSELSTYFSKFYEQRNIVLHGKKVPILVDELGLPKIPTFETVLSKGAAWSDKNHSWADVHEMQTSYIVDTFDTLFKEVLFLVNDLYAKFYDIITDELKSIPTSLEFQLIDMNYIACNSIDFPASGTSADTYRVDPLATNTRQPNDSSGRSGWPGFK